MRAFMLGRRFGKLGWRPCDELVDSFFGTVHAAQGEANGQVVANTLWGACRIRCVV
jgi:hypothetical protein